MKQVELRRLARLGAEARLGVLNLEIETIYRAFPDLRSGNGPSADSVVDARTGSTPAARRRPKLSAAARKRIADAQRKRWAEWKARQAQAGAENAAGSSRRNRNKKK